MRELRILVAILVIITSPGALAQSQTAFLSIPSSGFTPQNSDEGYNGNRSGTTRSFGQGELMFAPVNLPHRARVTSLRCGGRAPTTRFRVIFTLRRNEPQQVNVNMATVMTNFEETGFQFVATTSITAPVVNNERFNYYIVAELDLSIEAGSCPVCSVGFCRIGYTINE